jgi:hypothetical protein
MRYSPTIAEMLRRTVLSGGMEIDGDHMGPGIEVEVPAYSIHYNEQCYSDSFQYLSER